MSETVAIQEPGGQPGAESETVCGIPPCVFASGSKPIVVMATQITDPNDRPEPGNRS